MKRFVVLVTLQLLVVGQLVWSPPAGAQSMADYSAMPPFVSAALTPNVLLLVDNSGSMNNCAYEDTAEGESDCQGSSDPGLSTQYDASTTYYGYFDPTQCYTYASSTFSPVSAKPCSNQWDGNFMNWLTMRRIDITKWVMTGGLCNSIRSSENSCSTIRGQTQFSVGACCRVFYKQFDLNGLVPSSVATDVRCIRVESGNFYVLGNATCSSSSGSAYFIRIDAIGQATGVIQEVGNKARFGLMVFDDDGGNDNGAEVRSAIGQNLVSMVNGIEGLVATSWTPLAESTYEAARYFAQIPPYYETTDFSVNPNYDPYCFGDLAPSSGAGCRNATQGQWVPCCKSFIMLFTDGQPTRDTSIPSVLQDYAHTAAAHGSSVHCAGTAGCTSAHNSAPHTSGHGSYPDHMSMLEHHDNCSGYYGGIANDSCVNQGSHYLDDVAYWMHTTDLRQGTIPVIGEPGQALTGTQSVTLYTFYAFGQGGTLLADAAKVGGFNDINGDNLPGPDTREWDDNADGVPDTFFESKNAFDLRERLMAAITDILKRSASGTSVSILSTSSEGDGALYQAYFYPSKFEGLEELKWLGYLRGLFLDAYGNLREDTNQDSRLVLRQDRIVRMSLDPATNEVRANFFNDANEDGTADTTTPVQTLGLDDIAPIWEAGKQLALRDPASRTIYTWVDSDNDGVVDNGDFSAPTGEALAFTTANEATLRRYLRAATATEGQNVVNFIRGSDVSAYRERCLTVTGASAQAGCTGNQRVWKLGDIIASTPTVVASVKEQYDLIYGDATYTAYRKAYTKRRNVVYVGANDGMIHAFNAGIYKEGDDTSTPSEVERGWFQANPTSGSGWGTIGLGEELWAFVPYDDLPHLKWLTQTDYTHVYYADLKPKVSDVRIFNDATTGVTGLIDGQPGASHPNGWGTILIVGLRFGGGAINVDLNGDGDTVDAGEQAFRSSYYALDVTDPERPPKLLWRFTDPGLGFSTSYPALMHFKADASAGTPERWYMVVGSGPNNATGAGNRGYDGSSTQTGTVYVANLLTGALLNSYATDANAFMGDPSTVDGNLDYNVDVVYVGNVNMGSGTTWTHGKIYRLVTDNNPDPSGANWTLSTLINVDRPVLSFPSITKDSLNNLWVFSGTGRFMNITDKTNTDLQTVYGIKDPCWARDTAGTLCTTTYNKATDLLDMTNVTIKRVQDGAQVAGSTAACGGTATCSYDQLVQTARSRQGWYLDLSAPGTASERVLSPPVILGGIVLLTSFTPNGDVCALLGDSAIYALYYETGTAYFESVIGTYTQAGTDYVKRSDSLGKGMPTTVGLAIGKETKGFIQTSTGIISEISTETPRDRSRIINWGEGGDAMSEIEAIYLHVVK